MSEIGTTPSMQQYVSIKKEYPDCLLFFRMGDFYETFGEDAEKVSKLLDIVLTSRSKTEEKLPMAGIPYHSINSYLPKLINKGYRVVICEQGEKNSKTKIMNRYVTRVVTPSMWVDSDIGVSGKNSRYLLSIYIEGNTIGLSYVDINELVFYIKSDTVVENIVSYINRINPKEILLSDDMKFIKTENKTNSFLAEIKEKFNVTYVSDTTYSSEKLLSLMNVTSFKGFLLEKEIKNNLKSLKALASIYMYILETQKVNFQVKKIKEVNESGRMLLDFDVLTSLDIFNSGEKNLFNFIDYTSTPLGYRLLKNELSSPLTDVNEILHRHEYIKKLESIDISSLMEILSKISDLEKLATKVEFIAIQAQDFTSIESSLVAVIDVISMLNENNISINIDLQKCSSILKTIRENVNTGDKYSSENIIAKGVNTELDDLKELLGRGNKWIKTFLENEIQRTKINNLKIGYNKIFGYFIEVSNSNKDKVPDNYIRKQTTVNGERYITTDLKEKEESINNALEKITLIEKQLYDKFVKEFNEYVDFIRNVSKEIAYIDMLVSFAYTKGLYNLAIPNILERELDINPENISDSNKKNKSINSIIRIDEGRHLLIEDSLGRKYIKNDFSFTSPNIYIITGPNMAGKSTILRTVATIILLAQIGSAVPAKNAELTIFDRIFSRVGAKDRISSGESTFMVEMNEVSNILRNATERSFIILDEVGRGTSTYDGIAIAKAIIEYIFDNIKAITLFATHYHELTKLEYFRSEFVNMSVEVDEKNGEVEFMYKLRNGSADKSYGIYVAKIAGIPNEVIINATKYLKSFEKKSRNNVNIFEEDD